MTPTRTKRRVSVALAERKARFRIALAIAGLTAEQWAKANKVSEGFVSRVLSGRGVSRPLDEKIAAFTAKHLRNVA